MGKDSFFGGNLLGQEPWARRGEQAAAIAANTIPVGVINAYYGTTAPAGWLLCDGAAIPAAYPALIALVGANTPNLKGKVLVGMDAAQTEFDVLGETGGEKTHVLTVAELAAHSHVTVSGNVVLTDGGVTYFANASGPNRMSPSALANTGSGTAHNNLQPYCAISYIIKAS